jgi:hypothetical protein
VAAQRELVEVGAGELELVADLGGLLEHLLPGERVGEAVVDHRVERLGVAHPVAEARVLQQVRRLGHRLHPARDRDVEVADPHGLVDDARRAQARGADLVDGLARDLLRDAGLDLGLAARDLALAGLEDLPEDHVLDLVWLYLRPLERRGDCGAAELGGVEAR